MSVITEIAPQQAVKRGEAAPALVLFGALLLLGVWAAATGNLDMGWMSSALLIGP